MENALPLSGIRVIEFSHVIMGPALGCVLADLGADVIKVEPAPHGDHTRRMSGAMSGVFIYFNRNKRAVSLDLNTSQGFHDLVHLIASADVLTENFRPRMLEDLGLNAERLKEINPRLVTCSLKGFLRGPYDGRTAMDEAVQMMAGLAFMTGPAGRPLRAGASVNDIMGALFGAIGILAALRERDRTGHGSHVSTGLFETCAFLVGTHMAKEAVTGEPCEPMPERRNVFGIYDVFRTRDRSELFVGVVSDRQWEAFCNGIGREDLLDVPEFASNADRLKARPRLIPIVAAILEQFTRLELEQRLEQYGISFAPVARPSDLFDDPHLVAGGGLLNIATPDGGRTKLPALPLEFDGVRMGLRRQPPNVGEHNDEVLSEVPDRRRMPL